MSTNSPNSPNSPNSTERRDVESRDRPHEVRRGSAVRTATYAIGGGLVLFAIGAWTLESGLLDRWLPGSDAAHQAAGRSVRQQPGTRQTARASAAFEAPPDSAIPSGPGGEAIRRGQQIFMNTGANARDFVGNALSCANCHLDAGRRADSAPMWAAWVAYPKYRSKNKKVNTMEDRVNGCFSYSMNAQDSPSGGPPPKGHPIYTDLATYFHWLATQAPTNVDMKGGGYPKLKKTAQGYDRQRGETVFLQQCATCHGADGQGRKDLNGRYIFPPLWGPHSYNWGAGMARVDTAAAFIRANMPLGQPNKLSEQQAWDAAAWVDSHERPKDPRQKASVEQAAKEFHDGEETFYGKTVDGVLIGQGVGAREH
jgi:thiosulfate dehydrogenase